MGSFKDFFLFCSGVDRPTLGKCPSDEQKYLGIGATVFFTGILAFISSAYALFTVFDSYLAAVVFGLIWGLMIFNLDRYIVLSMKMQGLWWRNLFMAFPRLVMAVLLALVISKPLELKIFEKEINAELLSMEQEVFKTQEDRVKERFQADIDQTRAEIQLLQKEIDEKAATRDTLAKLALMEADGTGGSRKKNLGPIYLAKKAAADKANEELEQLKARNLPLIQEKTEQMAVLVTGIGAAIQNLERSTYGGLASRMEALGRLAGSSQAIWYASIFITLLFISIETAPIFVKLISYRSPYDYLLHNHEQVFEMEHKEETSLRELAVWAKLKKEKEVKHHEVEAEITLEKEIIDHRLREKLEQLKSGRWRLEAGS